MPNQPLVAVGLAIVLAACAAPKPPPLHYIAPRPTETEQIRRVTPLNACGQGIPPGFVRVHKKEYGVDVDVWADPALIPRGPSQ